MHHNTMNVSHYDLSAYKVTSPNPVVLYKVEHDDLPTYILSSYITEYTLIKMQDITI